MNLDEQVREYRSQSRRKWMIVSIMTIIALVAGMMEIALGPYNIGFVDAYSTLWDHLLGHAPVDEMDDYVVWNRSFPRALAVLIVGAGLGVCGAAMQSALKNPLADPYTTGISSGAGLGVSLAVIAGFSVLSSATVTMAIITNSFIFALIPAAVIIVFTWFKRNASSTVMILIGVAVMYVFNSLTTILKLSATEESYAQVYTWGLGTLGSSTWGNLPYMLVATVIAIILMYALNTHLNLLSGTDDMAWATGINPKRTRLIVISAVSLVTAVLVCFTGTIGFVGLVAPHIMRIILGSDNRYLIPASAASGAMFLSVSDCVAIEMTSTGLPVGVVTSLVGGPLFIYILIKQHKSSWN